MAFMKVAYVGHFHGTQALEVSQTRHTKYAQKVPAVLVSGHGCLVEFHDQKPDVIVWPAGEFAAINAARVAGNADNETRDLVARLEAARKECLQ